jgi:hypothetical protein
VAISKRALTPVEKYDLLTVASDLRDPRTITREVPKGRAAYRMLRS